MKNETKFHSFNNEVIRGCAGLTSELTLPCQRKRLRRFDDGASPHTYETLKDRHCHMYF